MNSYVQQSVNFRSFEFIIKQLIQLCINEFQSQIEKLISELQLTELSYYQISNLYINKSEELYQKGYKLYSNDKQYDEAIKILDKALSFNTKHQLSLYSKGDSLRLLKDYKEALKVIDQSLSINPNHLSSLQSKGHCLQNQNNYQEALLFYEKALKIDSNHQWTKNRKDECLKALNTK